MKYIYIMLILSVLGCEDYNKEIEKLTVRVKVQGKIIEELHDYAHMLRKGEKSSCCDQGKNINYFTRCCRAQPIEEWCPTGYMGLGGENCIYCTCGCPPYPDY